MKLDRLMHDEFCRESKNRRIANTAVHPVHALSGLVQK